VRIRRTLTGLIALGAMTGACTGSALAAKPDVTAKSVSAQGNLEILAAAPVTVTIGNVGKGRARAPQISVLVSKDRRRSRTDPVVGRAATKGLRAKKQSVARVVSVAPSELRPGKYFLIACVATKKQAQTSKRNDCSASKRPVRVKAAAAAIVPRFSTVDSAAVTATVGSGGGSIAVALPGGTKAELTVKPKALAVATVIRMVPVVGIAPVPAGIKPTDVVLIEPEGLVAPESTLTFSPVKTGLSKIRAFAFGGEDESIVAAPLLPRSGVALNASVFGGYGIGSAPRGKVRAKARAASTGLGERPDCPTAPRAASPQAAISAVDPCQAESLRKRGEEIGSTIDFSTPEGIDSGMQALDAFVASEVNPAIEAAVNAGALADEVAHYVSIVLGIERQRQLLGVEGGSDAVANLPSLMKRVADNSIKRCETRTQGPMTTAIQVLQLERQIQLLGGDTESIDADFDARCASKPWHLLHDVTVGENWTVQQPPPLFTAGNGHVDDLEVPAPTMAQMLGGGVQPGRKALSYSGLTCSPGAAFTSCTVTAASGDLEVGLKSSRVDSKTEVRCGRKVRVPYVINSFKFTMIEESQTLHIVWVIPTQPPQEFDLPSSGAFDRALSVATPKEDQVFEIPDEGGTVSLVGSSPDFHGSMLAINDHGLAQLKLSP
jgi:hypothetical protein